MTDTEPEAPPGYAPPSYDHNLSDIGLPLYGMADLAKPLVFSQFTTKQIHLSEQGEASTFLFKLETKPAPMNMMSHKPEHRHGEKPSLTQCAPSITMIDSITLSTIAAMNPHERQGVISYLIDSIYGHFDMTMEALQNVVRSPCSFLGSDASYHWRREGIMIDIGTLAFGSIAEPLRFTLFRSDKELTNENDTPSHWKKLFSKHNLTERAIARLEINLCSNALKGVLEPVDDKWTSEEERAVVAMSAMILVMDIRFRQFRHYLSTFSFDGCPFAFFEFILTKRLEQAKDKGCDAVDPDNIALDYSNGSGFTPDISKDDQNEFIQWLTAEAHRIGLGVGCKNCASLWTDETRDAVISLFDFAVVEECDRYNECDKYEGFIAQMKPVFDIEYTDATGGDCSINTKSASEICGNLNRLNIDGVIKGCQLGVQVTQCRRLASDFE
ncbi:hypothetical protein BCR33DRAFT_848353 [Rhizoclosmatium globosum]|uniref:alpha-galactosidase n=1 Tax=Rhizoclosmatium globosum TaxID=329046 RepID=A0A1Y2CKW9_9FUNG|nr:hypothetical protein BCR33DRAFT_848353 [Rhizoclosmatium globosum]|eukprot:ORY47607.1 hypothetical protein BCR33DRAFT_848353 [Rhizoclosmatium globosum]